MSRELETEGSLSWADLVMEEEEEGNEKEEQLCSARITIADDISEADYCEFDKLPDVEFAKDEEDYDMRPLGGLNRFRECVTPRRRKNPERKSVSGKDSVPDWLLNTNTTMKEDDAVETYDDDFDNIPPEWEAIFPEDGVSRTSFDSLKLNKDTDIVPQFNFQLPTISLKPIQNRLRGRQLKAPNYNSWKELQALGIKVSEELVMPCDKVLARHPVFGRWSCEPSLLRRSWTQRC